VLWMPDLDSSADVAAAGPTLEAVLTDCEVAYVDGCFLDDDELPDRDMSEIPHPRVRDTLARIASLEPELRTRVRFIHLNHTNPLTDPASEARAEVTEAGAKVADEGERITL